MNLSNCLIEAIKFKLKHKGTKIYFYINHKFLPHFCWKYAGTFYHYTNEDKDYTIFLFKGKIKKFPIKVFISWNYKLWRIL